VRNGGACGAAISAACHYSCATCPDKSFDRVLSFLVLHYVREPNKAIGEMCRVARPGASVWGARGGFIGNRIFFDTAAALDPAAEKHRARYSTHPMMRPGELAGLGATRALTTCATVTPDITRRRGNRTHPLSTDSGWTAPSICSDWICGRHSGTEAPRGYCHRLSRPRAVPARSLSAGS
jgi:SAM-dependent methyltransferase